MLGTAAVCAGLAASKVNSYTSEVQAQVGPLVPVVTARVDLPKGKLIRPRDLQAYLGERRVPERFVPPSALRAASAAVGYRMLTTIRAGDYVSEASLGASAAAGRPPAADSRGRLVEVPVAGAETIAGALVPGSRVDVLITTERGARGSRTYLALQRVELVDFRAQATDAPGAGQGERGALATLRVTLSQAVLLTAARNFARELRLVPRAAGDDRRLGPTVVTASGLGA
jgi:pilus assembly protein CpaB